MKTIQPLFILFACGLLAACNSEAQPSTGIFKEAFVKQLQLLRPEGYERRAVKLVQVTPGKTNSGLPTRLLLISMTMMKVIHRTVITGRPV